jgi:hypothetical protein
MLLFTIQKFRAAELNTVLLVAIQNSSAQLDKIRCLLTISKNLAEQNAVLFVAISKNFAAWLNKIQYFWTQFQKVSLAAEQHAVNLSCFY